MQSLLFGLSSPDEYEELLDFVEDRRTAKIERIVSILNAQRLLLGSGAFLEGSRAQSAAEEIPSLVAYARGLLEREDAPRRKLEVLPRNLGKPFAAKRWGLPLFGDYRPPVPPGSGLLLIYSAPDGDGKSGELEAARLGPGDRLSYRERALAIDSSGHWLSLRAFSRADSQEEALPEEKGSRTEVFSFSRYAFALDKKPRRRSFRGRIADPYEAVYPYWFYDGPAAASNLARFIGDVLCGIFRVPLRDSEKLAEAFSERLP
jgi:hypothetical protein